MKEPDKFFEDAFSEYAGLTQAQRETIKLSSPEVPDLSQLHAVTKRYDALKEVVSSQLDVITNLQAQCEYHKQVSRVAALAIVAATQGEHSAQTALRIITASLLELPQKEEIQ